MARLKPPLPVVFLQHPRESKVAIGTARMAHLALMGSELIEGIHLDEHPRVAQLLDEPGAAVLFPGEGAREVSGWLAAPPTTLIVLDGTWWQAQKLLKLNPRLAALPRVSFTPSAPGNYRIRKEPSDAHLATVEAVAGVLDAFAGTPGAFAGLLAPFDFLVEQQIAAASAGGRARRRRREGRGAALPELSPLLDEPGRSVILYAEANAHRRDERAPGAPELLHLVAARPGDVLDVVLKPRRPLGRDTPARLGLPREVIEAGLDVASALQAFHAFVGPRPVWCSWGAYPRDLLAHLGEPRHGFIDLRALAARSLQASPGGILAAAERLGVDAPEEGSRARGMLARLAGILDELLRRERGRRLTPHPNPDPRLRERAPM